MATEKKEMGIKEPEIPNLYQEVLQEILLKEQEDSEKKKSRNDDLKACETNFINLLNSLGEASSDNEKLNQQLNPATETSLVKEITDLYESIKQNNVDTGKATNILDKIELFVKSLVKENPGVSYKNIEHQLNSISSQLSKSFGFPVERYEFVCQKALIEEHYQSLSQALDNRRVYLQEKTNKTKGKQEKYTEEMNKITGFIDALNQGKNKEQLTEQKEALKTTIESMKVKDGYLDELKKDPHAESLLSIILKIVAALSVIGIGVLIADAVHKKTHGVGFFDNANRRREIQENKNIVDEVESTEKFISSPN